ncbi:MAG: hypothetical protein JWN15_1477 [Firmicutes bacterium]|nr:hypothetical protein [Bacillota bacterium]
MMNAQALTIQEILRQPDCWQQAIDTMDELAPALTNLMRTAGPDIYLFTGCGTSYYLAMIAASFFQEATGLAARAVPASELILSRSTFTWRRSRRWLSGSAGTGTWGISSSSDLGPSLVPPVRGC